MNTILTMQITFFCAAWSWGIFLKPVHWDFLFHSRPHCITHRSEGICLQCACTSACLLHLFLNAGGLDVLLGFFMEEFFSASRWIWVVISLVLVCQRHFHGSGDVGAQVGDSQCNDSKVLQAVADILKECLGESPSTKEWGETLGSQLTFSSFLPLLRSWELEMVKEVARTHTMYVHFTQEMCFLLAVSLGTPLFLSCCSKSFWIVLNTTVALPKSGNPGQDFVRATTCCIVLQRLLASRPCFEAIRTMPDVVAVIFQVKKKIVPHSGNPSSVQLKSRIHLCLQQTGWWFAS